MIMPWTAVWLSSFLGALNQNGHREGVRTISAVDLQTDGRDQARGRRAAAGRPEMAPTRRRHGRKAEARRRRPASRSRGPKTEPKAPEGREGSGELTKDVLTAGASLRRCSPGRKEPSVGIQTVMGSCEIGLERV